MDGNQGFTGRERRLTIPGEAGSRGKIGTRMDAKIMSLLAAAVLCWAVSVGCQKALNETAGWSPIEQDGRWGFQDRTGRIVLPPKYFMAYPFLETGLAAVADEQGWVYINAGGEEIIRPFIFDNGPDEFSEGLARFVQNGKFGYFDRYGQVVIAPSFDFAYGFKNGRAAICMGCALVPDGEHTRIAGGTWYWINRRGDRVSQLQPDETPQP